MKFTKKQIAAIRSLAVCYSSFYEAFYAFEKEHTEENKRRFKTWAICLDETQKKIGIEMCPEAKFWANQITAPVVSA